MTTKDGDDALWHLLYSSREGYEMDALDLLKLLFDAREHNMRRGITGLLLHHANRFMQLLEGPHAEVEALFARIVVDPRHEDIVVEASGPLADRLFADWNMGFAEVPTLSGRCVLGNVESDTEALNVLQALGCANPTAARMLAFLGDDDITLHLR